MATLKKILLIIKKKIIYISIYTFVFGKVFFFGEKISNTGLISYLAAIYCNIYLGVKWYKHAMGVWFPKKTTAEISASSFPVESPIIDIEPLGEIARLSTEVQNNWLFVGTLLLAAVLLYFDFAK